MCFIRHSILLGLIAFTYNTIPVTAQITLPAIPGITTATPQSPGPTYNAFDNQSPAPSIAPFYHAPAPYTGGYAPFPDYQYPNECNCEEVATECACEETPAPTECVETPAPTECGCEETPAPTVTECCECGQCTTTGSSTQFTTTTSTANTQNTIAALTTTAIMFIAAA